jgi:polar amino acid transport system substrate-binding protein
MRRATLAIVSVLALGLAVLAGCGGKKESSSTSSSEGGTADAAACTPTKMQTHTAGTLTIATDKPAYPKGKVKWTVEPFDSSYAPGPKSFDFDVNEISITPVREKAVDFSAPYYKAQQAVVALEGSEAAQAKSLAELKNTKFGVQINTTSLSAVDEEIEPSSKPEVFNGSGDVVTALKNGQVEAVVVDLPTALYLTEAQVENATIVGQFGKPTGEEWGALLAKGSPLTACVSGAIESLEESGELEKITQRWMSQAAAAPQLR